MIIAKNDEDKRSRVWNYVTGITTVLIIIVAGYFIYQGFFGNPLEGKWKHDESDMILEVDDHNEAELDWKNLIDGKDVDVELGYTLDIKAKQITFTVKQEELDETAKELGDNVTASEVEQAGAHRGRADINWFTGKAGFSGTDAGWNDPRSVMQRKKNIPYKTGV